MACEQRRFPVTTYNDLLSAGGEIFCGSVGNTV
jgi:hypothetical protein